MTRISEENKLIAKLWRRNADYTWNDVAREFNQTTGMELTGNACRKRYERISIFIEEKPEERVKAMKLDRFVDSGYDSVLVAGDIHAPFMVNGYPYFLKDVAKRYLQGRSLVVFIGDLLENHNISRHPTHPNALDPITEVRLAVEQLAELQDLFPEAVCIKGNHDLILERSLKASGIPGVFLRSLEEHIGLPEGWVFYDEAIIDGVNYFHGDGLGSGQVPAFRGAANLLEPVVAGHYHTKAGVQWHFGRTTSYWGLQVGCGVNEESYAMAYRKRPAKPFILGCGVVLNKGREPLFVPYPRVGSV